mmetsp:Transcript_3239/g.6464  ORF Transcript_3239/g.6464 Transcript_3239/m.6464 type:complete len:114 (-) Transcript_3239:1256-1597(-)
MSGTCSTAIHPSSPNASGALSTCQLSLMDVSPDLLCDLRFLLPRKFKTFTSGGSCGLEAGWKSLAVHRGSCRSSSRLPSASQQRHFSQRSPWRRHFLANYFHLPPPLDLRISP